MESWRPQKEGHKGGAVAHSVSPLNGTMRIRGARGMVFSLVGLSRDDMMHSTSRVSNGFRWMASGWSDLPSLAWT